MMRLFQQRIEDKLREEKLREHHLRVKEQEKQRAAYKAPVETIAGDSMSFKKSQPLNEIIQSSLASALSATNKKKVQEMSTGDNIAHESMEDKKDRLFRWNQFQTVKFTQDDIKETLLQNINILRFLNMMETFDNTLLVWGSNEAMQFGLHLKRDLSKYYQINSSEAVNARISQEKILQKILAIKAGLSNTP